MISDDYKKGWYDGYHAKNEIKFYPANTTSTLNRDVYNIPATTITGNTVQKKCSVCGMEFTNPDGSLKTLGYVCGNDKCPSKITWTHPGVTLGMFETVSYTPDMSITYKGTTA
jgi:hypothetical protein